MSELQSILDDNIRNIDEFFTKHGHGHPPDVGILYAILVAQERQIELLEEIIQRLPEQGKPEPKNNPDGIRADG